MTYPIFRPIGDTAVLVEFGDVIDDQIHDRVLCFDQAISNNPFTGITETMPAYTSVYVGYDPLVTEYKNVCDVLQHHLHITGQKTTTTSHWDIPVSYASEHAPDMAAVCDLTGLAEQDVLTQHASASYKVYMYGFAPGYAYLGGVPEQLQIARKTTPVMGVAPNTVMIAGPQALITTIPMPSGWWRIGKAAKTPLQSDAKKPFLFSIGDTVSFIPVTPSEFERFDG